MPYLPSNFRNAHRIAPARPVNSAPAQPTVAYDYHNQAWVEDGVYVTCGHREEHRCNCFGKRHAGEPVNLHLADLGNLR
jgi:hypothetical protein